MCVCERNTGQIMEAAEDKTTCRFRRIQMGLVMNDNDDNGKNCESEMKVGGTGGGES